MSVLPLDKTVKEDRRYSTLRNDLDTRRTSGVDTRFVVELEKAFKNDDEIFAAAGKYPVKWTKDGVLVVGRAMARLLFNTLRTPEDPDPNIPGESYSFSYNDLSEDQMLELLREAMSHDILKTHQRGLKDADLLHDVQAYVNAGWTKEKIVKFLTEGAMLKKWKVEELYSKASGIRTQLLITKVRDKAASLISQGKAVNYQNECILVGLDPKKAPLCAQPSRGEHTGERETAALAALKQTELVLVERLRQFTERNRVWYESSVKGTPRTIQGIARGTKMTGTLYKVISQLLVEEADAALAYAKDARDRANSLVTRMEGGSHSSGAVVERLRNRRMIDQIDSMPSKDEITTPNKT